MASATLLLVASLSLAQVPENETTLSSEPSAALSATVAGSCEFIYAPGEVPDCLHASHTGKLSVARRYWSLMTFDSRGLAAVWSREHGWMYVNRRGAVLITGVQSMDNFADSFHDGLVRVVRDNKYGFADRKGRLVIDPVYDGAMNFEKGRAKVCKGCKIETKDEYSFFSGGEWWSINTMGDRVK
jgi:WG containing repeat